MNVLVVILLWSVIYTQFCHSVFEHDFSVGVLENPAYSELIASLGRYQEQHSLRNINASIVDPSFCQRKFAVGIYACPQMVGNRMHEFLNAYIGAFVTNRTFVWQFCTRKPCQLDNEGDCDQVLERFPWLSSSWKLGELWKSNQCDDSPFGAEVIPTRFRYMAEEAAMCCGLDEIQHPVVNFGTHDGHEFAGLVSSAARLSAESKHRAKVLFEHGENFAYGALFRTVFRFRDYLIEKNNRNLLAGGLHLRHTGSNVLNSSKSELVGAYIPSNAPRPFVVGVHLRHAGGEEKGVDASGIKCVNQVLAAMNVTGPCYVLLAADRNQSLQHWTQSEHLRCQIITSTHDLHHQEWNEHGPFTGVIAMQDIEMVSRADAFIGSGYTHAHLQGKASTFSLLIAERIASNGGYYSATVPSRFLQACVPVRAGRFRLLPIYDDSFQCPVKLAKDMPDLCNTTAQTT